VFLSAKICQIYSQIIANRVSSLSLLAHDFNVSTRLSWCSAATTSLANEGSNEHDDDEKVEGWADVGGDSDADETEARTRAEGGSAHYCGGARAGA
jgi:hypothetical protein